MIYINGEAVAPTIKGKTPNILDDYTVQTGGVSFSYGNSYNPNQTSNQYHYGLIELEIGKPYDIIFPPVVKWAFQLYDKQTSGSGYTYIAKINTDWRTSQMMTFVATYPMLAIVYEVSTTAGYSGDDYLDIASQVILRESVYEVEEINLNTNEWVKGGLSYNKSNTFDDNKTTDTNRFRYNELVATNDRKPYIIMYGDNHGIAFHHYASNDKPKMDTGWKYYWYTNSFYYPSFAILCSCDSSYTIDYLIANVIPHLHIYKIKGVKE